MELGAKKFHEQKTAGPLFYAVSCELGLKETTEPTGGTQHREYWGGPTNGQAAACRRRLATAVKPLGAGALGSKLRPFSSMILFGPVFPPVPLLGLSHLACADSC